MKNSVRITSGTFRGREILTPGGGTHPMGERERLALFNMITDRLLRAQVLDAYAGSGALGIEALSRGVRSCVFLERSAGAVKVIRENLRRLEVTDGAAVQKGSVLDFDTTEIYDLIIADPPYDDFKIAEVEHLAKFLKKGGCFVLSHPDILTEIDGLNLIKTRQYARAHISIFTK